MSNTTAYQQQHLRSLTGLRFFAALSVFVAHVGVHWPAYKLGNLPFGAAGVSFFYVLSGFILTYVYGSRLELETPSNQLKPTSSKNTFSFKQFYLRRFARIWPLHFVTLLLSLFFVMGWHSFFNRPHAIGKLAVNSLLLQSWIPNYDWIYSLNGPSWSLAVEAFFYVLFPFLLLGGAKRFVGKYVLIILSTIVGLVAINQLVPRADSWIQMNSIVHANPLMRLFEFATGIGCGFLFLKHSHDGGDRSSSFARDSRLEVFAIVGLLAFFTVASFIGMYSLETQESWPLAFLYWFRFCGAAPIFAIAIYVFARTSGAISRLLSNETMVYLGEISYSFYMVHMGVMLVLKRTEWLDGPWVEAGVVASCFCLSLTLSSILYQLVELPCRRSIVDFAEGVKAENHKGKHGPWMQSIRNWIRTPCLVPLVLLAVGSLWFVSANRFDARDLGRIAEIIESTPQELRTVNFESDAVLLGVSSKPTEQGGLILELAWTLKPDRREERFLKLLDGNQKVIGRGNANRKLFNSISGEETVVDRITIKAKKMENVETIAVGFFDKTRKSAKIDSGPRSARDRQLHVWTKKQ